MREQCVNMPWACLRLRCKEPSIVPADVTRQVNLLGSRHWSTISLTTSCSPGRCLYRRILAILAVSDGGASNPAWGSQGAKSRERGWGKPAPQEFGFRTKPSEKLLGVSSNTHCHQPLLVLSYWLLAKCTKINWFERYAPLPNKTHTIKPPPLPQGTSALPFTNSIIIPIHFWVPSTRHISVTTSKYSLSTSHSRKLDMSVVGCGLLSKAGIPR